MTITVLDVSGYIESRARPWDTYGAMLPGHIEASPLSDFDMEPLRICPCQAFYLYLNVS